jgi:heme a synthase
MNSWEQAVIGIIALAVMSGAVIWVANSSLRFRKLVLTTLIATFGLIVLGAYVRLSDAGLGCPDWPGCYGNLAPHLSHQEISAAEAAQPGGPVSMAKAWKEMVHRYLAMIVGSLIAAIAISAWRNRRTFGQSPALASGIVALVLVQALLGAWTVTMLLKPAVVTAHLLGGMGILVLLSWLYLRQDQDRSGSGGVSIIMPSLRAFAALALLILACQIALGGWVSTNYAALACGDFPTCSGEWIPQMRFADSFHVIRPLGMGPDGVLLTNESLRAIHWAHRVGALLTTVVLAILAIVLARKPGFGTAAGVLTALLALQLLLGIAIVVLSLPLADAIAHNGGAALLLGWLVFINFRLSR